MITLINPKDDFLGGSGDRPSLGTAYIAANLRKDKYDTAIFDMNHCSESELFSHLLWLRPEVVGISFTTPLYSEAVKLAKYVRKYYPFSRPVTIAGGGVHCTNAELDLELFNHFDVIVKGEGEYVLEGIEKMDKTLLYAEKIKNLDELPFPARDLLPMGKYSLEFEGRKATPILASRDCCFSCAFCSDGGQTIRAHSIDYTIEEIKEIKNRHGITSLIFYDDVFTANKKRTASLMERILDEDLDIRFRATTRASLVDYELLKKMHEAGCRELCFGVESGSERVLKNIEKRMSLDANRETFKLCRKTGIKTRAYFIVGNPGEGYDDVMKTLDFAKELSPDTAHFYPLTPYPGTPIWETPEAYGIFIHKNSDWNYMQANKDDDPEVMVTTSELSRGQISALLGYVKREWKCFDESRRLKRCLN